MKIDGEHRYGGSAGGVGAALCLVLLGIFLARGPFLQAPHASGGDPGSRVLNLVRYVNPFIGTIGDGNAFPGATMPHGMVQWSPDTSAGGLSRPGGYNVGDLIIRGFSLTHLSGAGCVAFGDIPFMPTLKSVTTPPLPNGSPYSARFVHAREQASPGYYGVRLATGIRIQLSVTPRTGFGVFTYPASRHASLLVNAGGSAGPASNAAASRNAAIHIPTSQEITGSATGGSFCHLVNTYTVYFAARFSHPFTAFGTWSGSRLQPGVRSSRGPRAGAFLTFDTTRDQTVEVKVGLSYVSEHNALLNLRDEDPGWSFSTVRSRAGAAWNRLLNRIQATGGSPAQEQVFYTALYHALLAPTIFSDVDGRYLGFDGRVHIAQGYTQYTNFSGWDIYRTDVPLLAWLTPRETSDMMHSLLADGQQGGWLPKWPVANADTGEMNGDSADPIIAGAYAFGARHFDLRAALHAMIKGATQPGRERPGLAGYLRLGYAPPELGYIPQDGPGAGSAATTLEYAIDDFAIARLARSLGDGASSTFYMRRAQNWQRLFNPATGVVEPVVAGGAFPARFDPNRVVAFVEGNAWQYSWMVPQNLRALFRAMGGNRAVGRRLDRFFAQLQAGPEQPYDWAGNEPGLEVPWEYDFVGMPWRTQAVVRRIATQLYTATADGLPGNDDLGTMSAWYVWAALGLYPEIPGVAGLAVGSPLFPHITVHWGDGQLLSIAAPGASPRQPYIAALRLDGRPYTRLWLPLRALAGTATLSFTLSGQPHPAWGSAPAEAPPSFSDQEAPAIAFTSPSGTVQVLPGGSATLTLGVRNVTDRPLIVRWRATVPAGVALTPASSTLQVGSSSSRSETLTVGVPGPALYGSPAIHFHFVAGRSASALSERIEQIVIE